MKSNRQIIIDALETVVSNPEHNENIISRYFDPGYQQVVDGNLLDYKNFVSHMAALKSQTTYIKVLINSVVAEGETVFTHHAVTVDKLQGGQSEFEVFARFTLSSGKIIRCEELTRMVSGVPADRDMGSRR